jgi:hypothetical protein
MLSIIRRRSCELAEAQGIRRRCPDLVWVRKRVRFGVDKMIDVVCCHRVEVELARIVFMHVELGKTSDSCARWSRGIVSIWGGGASFAGHAIDETDDAGWLSGHRCQIGELLAVVFFS